MPHLTPPARRVLPVLALAAVLTACAQEPDGPDDDAAARSSTAGGPGVGELTVTLDPGDGGAVQQHTLTCAGEARGTVPDPRAVCAHLASLDDPFAPLPADAVCTEQYGGPQTARIIGTWAGEPVDLALSRTDGCRIAQWDALGGLLPGS